MPEIDLGGGRRIAYDDRTRDGAGPLALLMHGWGASRAQLTPLLDHLHTPAVAFDFRGHGGSTPGAGGPGEPGDFGEDALLEDALAVVEHVGAGEVVPVAVAHAGWVALELCRRLGARVRHVVLLSWIVLDPPPPFLGALAALQSPVEWEAARDRLFAMWLEGVDDPAVRGFVTDVMAAHGFGMWARSGREIAAAYAREGNPLRAFAALPSPPRVLHLYAQPRDEGYLAAQAEFARAHPWFAVQRLEAAASHFPSIEAPALVAAAVDAQAGAAVSRRARVESSPRPRTWAASTG